LLPGQFFLRFKSFFFPESSFCLHNAKLPASGWFLFCNLCSGMGPLGSVTQVALLVTLASIILYQLSLVSWKAFSNKYIKSYKSLSIDEKIEWGARAPSTLHAIILCFSCIYLFLLTDLFDEFKVGWFPPKENSFKVLFNPLHFSIFNMYTHFKFSNYCIFPKLQNTSTPLLYRSSPLSTATLNFSVGYFLSDIIMFMFYFPHGTLAMNIHHVCALTSVTISGFTGLGHVYVLMVMSTEVTTPLVNARWLLEKAGLKQHKLYIINGLTMMVMWFFDRIVFLAFYFFPLLYRHKEELVLLNSLYRVLLLAIPPLLTLLNMFWFVKIVKGAMRLLKPKKK